VVEADSVNSFKSRLDKYWANQEFAFKFNSELTGTGGLTRKSCAKTGKPIASPFFGGRGQTHVGSTNLVLNGAHTPTGRSTFEEGIRRHR